MKIRSLPKELLIEVLHYLSDYERLEGLGQILDEEFTLEDVRAALREIANRLAEGTPSRAPEDESTLPEACLAEVHLSHEARRLISTLSSVERERLLKAFGLHNPS
jgi:hypothetical protein